MNALLDTNILIHREGRVAVREDIGHLFRWLDQLDYVKWIHPESVDEINRHADQTVKDTLGVKLGAYRVVKALAPDTDDIQNLRADDRSDNDSTDTNLLAEVASNRMDVLITEDRGIHRKAEQIGLRHRVHTIESFLEKALAENPDLVDYPVLSVRKEAFGNLNLADPFFDSFRADYNGFDAWFEGKAQEEAYVSLDDDGRIVAFLYVKLEGPGEDYRDIQPEFQSAHRLKIGTLKVEANGFRLGERLLKIVFDNALNARVDEIYVTLFKHSSDHERLAAMLEDWGFAHHGWKSSSSGEEHVFTRDFRPMVNNEPQHCFPFMDNDADKYLVAIYPGYHTELLPDSMLKTEEASDFEDNQGHRNALRKVYISRSWERGMAPGDIVIFYRTKDPRGPAIYTSVATTIGVVQRVHLNIPDLETFKELCKKRSVFSEEKLEEFWNRNPKSRPFVVDFLYTYSFPNRPNLQRMIDLGIIRDIESAPRGFLKINNEQFNALIEATNTDRHIIVD